LAPQAEATFCGVVTNRCVASSLLHAVKNGYSARLLEGGCMAASDEEHTQGVALIKEKGGGHVVVA
jgi:nicotinamidase-related amidase